MVREWRHSWRGATLDPDFTSGVTRVGSRSQEQLDAGAETFGITRLRLNHWLPARAC